MSTSDKNEIEKLAVALNTATTHLGRRIRRIDDHQEIGRAQLSALSVLVFGGPRTMGDLARDEMVSPATMHHVVAGLVEKKLAKRLRDPGDKRKMVIQATRAGIRFMEKARRARLDFYSEELKTLSETERQAVARFVTIAQGWLYDPTHREAR